MAREYPVCGISLPFAGVRGSSLPHPQGNGSLCGFNFASITMSLIYKYVQNIQHMYNNIVHYTHHDQTCA